VWSGPISTPTAKLTLSSSPVLSIAITSLLKLWERLTLFLRQADAPLDNNVRERALKKAILHRKNSLLYKTQNGAGVGDLFMRLIHTAELCGANPFDYLTGYKGTPGNRRPTANPAAWMPWNTARYRIGSAPCGFQVE
jgi:transposase